MSLKVYTFFHSPGIYKEIVNNYVLLYYTNDFNHRSPVRSFCGMVESLYKHQHLFIYINFYWDALVHKICFVFLKFSFMCQNDPRWSKT